MLINHTTGEIAYHAILLKEDGSTEVKQYELKNNKGNIEHIEPKII